MARLTLPDSGARLRQRWEHNSDHERLTRREHEIIHLLAAGMRNREIAAQLVISTGTVKKHLDNIYDKLGVHTRTGAVAAAQTRAATTPSAPPSSHT
jgi:DNA-binding NarL/FixJ family response regulator